MSQEEVSEILTKHNSIKEDHPDSNTPELSDPCPPNSNDYPELPDVSAEISVSEENYSEKENVPRRVQKGLKKESNSLWNRLKRIERADRKTVFIEGKTIPASRPASPPPELRISPPTVNGDYEEITESVEFRKLKLFMENLERWKCFKQFTQNMNVGKVEKYLEFWEAFQDFMEVPTLSSITEIYKNYLAEQAPEVTKLDLEEEIVQSVRSLWDTNSTIPPELLDPNFYFKILEAVQIVLMEHLKRFTQSSCDKIVGIEGDNTLNQWRQKLSKHYQNFVTLFINRSPECMAFLEEWTKLCDLPNCSIFIFAFHADETNLPKDWESPIFILPDPKGSVYQVFTKNNPSSTKIRLPALIIESNEDIYFKWILKPETPQLYPDPVDLWKLSFSKKERRLSSGVIKFGNPLTTEGWNPKRLDPSTPLHLSGRHKRRNSDGDKLTPEDKTKKRQGEPFTSVRLPRPSKVSPRRHLAKISIANKRKTLAPNAVAPFATSQTKRVTLGEELVTARKSARRRKALSLHQPKFPEKEELSTTISTTQRNKLREDLKERTLSLSPSPMGSNIQGEGGDQLTPNLLACYISGREELTGKTPVIRASRNNQVLSLSESLSSIPASYERMAYLSDAEGFDGDDDKSESETESSELEEIPDIAPIILDYIYKLKKQKITIEELCQLADLLKTANVIQMKFFIKYLGLKRLIQILAIKRKEDEQLLQTQQGIMK